MLVPQVCFIIVRSIPGIPWGAVSGHLDTDKLYPKAWANANLKVGIDTATPQFKLSLENDGGILAKTDLSIGDASATTLTTAGAGIRFIWYPKKAAIRAGEVIEHSDRWDDGYIGNHSAAFGKDVEAYSEASFATGNFSRAVGVASIAMGEED